MSHSINYTFEDEGGKLLGVPGWYDFEIEFDYTPGEPMVRYYKDGSGYPGSPPEIELTKYTCTHAECDIVGALLVGVGPREVSLRLSSVATKFSDLVETDEALKERLEETALDELQARSESEDY